MKNIPQTRLEELRRQRKAVKSRIRSINRKIGQLQEPSEITVDYGALEQIARQAGRKGVATKVEPGNCGYILADKRKVQEDLASRGETFFARELNEPVPSDFFRYVILGEDYAVIGIRRYSDC